MLKKITHQVLQIGEVKIQLQVSRIKRCVNLIGLLLLLPMLKVNLSLMDVRVQISIYLNRDCWNVLLIVVALGVIWKKLWTLSLMVFHLKLYIRINLDNQASESAHSQVLTSEPKSNLTTISQTATLSNFFNNVQWQQLQLQKAGRPIVVEFSHALLQTLLTMQYY